MTDVVPGGRRRIDRVLDSGYLRGLTDLRTPEVRHRRDEALAELAELNRLGHLLDERIAMVTAEQRRRAAIVFDGTTELAPDALPADDHSAGGRLARVFRLRADPDNSPTHRRRRRVERLVADVDLADVARRTDDELARVLRTFRHERRQVTDVSGRVRSVVDQCGDELGRRRVAPMGTGAAEEPETVPLDEHGRGRTGTLGGNRRP
ncbi:hypothetical protein [Cryptosporangium aurantiacum]|uniref:Uncharacterized protein n=1 Tax=Cryptosporangium aurantiacum TaxID=134849 RepID=A0A1M7RHF8_9ACTN|nr:hypothetical protein [Cryptosporangium aurantiacum]SHN45723.1 hypothetical protein SAMN05443668_112227 [Cryptosporangium aurantiacum]